jgi:hypothetical protein
MANFLSSIPLFEIACLVLALCVACRVGYEIMYNMYLQDCKSIKYKQITKKEAAEEELTGDDRIYLSFIRDREHQLKTLDKFTVNFTVLAFVCVALLFLTI